MKMPWNIPDLPVYSLATYSGESVNMNICTYVSSISMRPKLYSVAVYFNTKTLENISCSEYAVLQLLGEEHYNLIKKLGQTSGLIYPKENYLTKKKLLTEWQGYKVLKDISAAVLLKKMWNKSTGDHELFVFEAVKHKSFTKGYLSLNQLRDKKIIRG
ncbi:MAG: flavin reductase [Bacteroidota bacterium]|jgi:flavin reductase (DIM6/NTAB) family NADH-FMN oxidoreductase RutF